MTGRTAPARGAWAALALLVGLAAAARTGSSGRPAPDAMAALGREVVAGALSNSLRRPHHFEVRLTLPVGVERVIGRGRFDGRRGWARFDLGRLTPLVGALTVEVVQDGYGVYLRADGADRWWPAYYRGAEFGPMEPVARFVDAALRRPGAWAFVDLRALPPAGPFPAPASVRLPGMPGGGGAGGAGEVTMGGPAWGAARSLGSTDIGGRRATGVAAVTDIETAAEVLPGGYALAFLPGGDGPALAEAWFDDGGEAVRLVVGMRPGEGDAVDPSAGRPYRVTVDLTGHGEAMAPVFVPDGADDLTDEAIAAWTAAGEVFPV